MLQGVARRQGFNINYWIRIFSLFILFLIIIPQMLNTFWELVKDSSSRMYSLWVSIFFTLGIFFIVVVMTLVVFIGYEEIKYYYFFTEEITYEMENDINFIFENKDVEYLYFNGEKFEIINKVQYKILKEKLEKQNIEEKLLDLLGEN